MADDLLNPPGRPCRCGSGPCDRASAWTDPGQIARAIDRDHLERTFDRRLRIATRMERLRSRFRRQVIRFQGADAERIATALLHTRKDTPA